MSNVKTGSVESSNLLVTNMYRYFPMSPFSDHSNVSSGQKAYCANSEGWPCYMLIIQLLFDIRLGPRSKAIESYDALITVVHIV